jgi:hypothetical protein
MEEQLTKLTKSEGVKDSIKELQGEYSLILKDNMEIQREVVELGKQATRLQEFSQPMRVVKVAFESNNSLRELVMRQAEG